MLTRLATILFSIPPSQVENNRYFSLDGNCTSYCEANLSSDMLSNLLFFNRNSDLWNPTPNTSPDIFYAPLETLQDIIEYA